MAGLGRHCAEIMEGRHPDVLEMDAASNTGVDNIREIIESARYKPMVARYKVYLIDEVHMLSKGAFNALLKTLEEPPGHVKFIFATTEVRKVPLTVLSRCQRFDLRRVDVPVLIEHFKKIVANEGGEAEDEALALIARAAEGSVRDGLSLLDQALAMSAGKVAAATRARHAGPRRPRPHLRSAREAAAAAPPARRSTCSPACTATAPSPARSWPISPRPCTPTTRAKTLGAAAAGEGLSARSGGAPRRWPSGCRWRSWHAPGRCCSRAWRRSPRAPNQAAAAEMVLIRLAYTADLPAPDDIINALGGRPAARPAARRRRERRRREAAGGRRAGRCARACQPMRTSAARGRHRTGR